jgi:agarase
MGVVAMLLASTAILPTLGLNDSQSLSSHGTIEYARFITVIKQLDGTWFFIDRNGNPFYSLGVTAVRYDNRPNYESNVIAKYGSLDAWGTAVIERMESWGFNTLGAWSHKETLHKSLPYATVVIDVGQYAHDNGIPLTRWNLPDVFDPRWVSLANEAARILTENPPSDITPSGRLKDDENLIGYFISNDFYIARWSPVQDSESNEAMFRGDVDELLASQSDTDPAKARLIALGYDYHKWVREYSELYYKTVCDAIRAVDPSHLILGTRHCNMYMPQEDLEGARYCDVISVNFYQYLEYASDFQAACREQLESFYIWSGRPVLITEWSVRSRECDSDIANSGDSGPLVDTQAMRGEYYRKTLSELSALPFVIGMHWFMWTDKKVGENDNFGLVRVSDESYGFMSDVEAANLAVLKARTPNST